MRVKSAAWLGTFLLVVSAGALLSGCSGKSVDQNDPGALFKEAEEDVQSDHYQIALDKLRTIKNKFPYSKYALEAQLKIADVYFMQEAFPEAASTYESFFDLHPKHEKAPYAMYRAAKSYFNDVPSKIARDMTPASKALGAYNDFVKRFPNAPEVAEARTDIAEVRRLLAEKEFYIADFYSRRDADDSAKRRYEKVVELYPETAFAKEAQKKLAEIAQKTEAKK